MRKLLLTIVAVSFVLHGNTVSATMKLRSFAPEKHDRFFDPSDPGKAFIGDPYDWSGVGRDTHWATMISPSYFLTANHFHPQVGSSLYFYETNDPNGSREIHTIESGTVIGGTDLWLGRLAVPVSRSIAKYPILSLPDNSHYDDRELYTFGLSNGPHSPTNVRLGRNQIDADSCGLAPDDIHPESMIYLFDYDPVDGMGADESHLRHGDSGGPSFTIFKDSPTLVGIHWFIWELGEDPVVVGSADTFVPEYTDQISAAMTDEKLILLPEPVFVWNGSGDGDWDSVGKWAGGLPNAIPDVPTSAVVPTDTVTVTADRGAYSLTVRDGGRVVVGDGNILDVITNTEVINGGLNVRGELDARSVVLREAELNIAPGAVLNIDSALTMENTRYVCEVDGSENSLLAAGGQVDIAPDSTLAVQAVGRLAELGNASRTVIYSDATVNGIFTNQPEVGQHLGLGVFYQDLEYGSGAVTVELFQAAVGDIDVDRRIDFNDVWTMLTAGKYNTAEPADWTEGDCSGDGVVDYNDVWALLTSGWYNQGPYAEMSFDEGDDQMPSCIMGSAFSAYDGNAIVPEPGTAAMLAIALGLLLATRGRGRLRLCRKTRRVGACTHAEVAAFPRACKQAPYGSGG